MTRCVLVWDMPTRVFHWSLAFSFLGAYLTGESERWALIHVALGYTFLGLIVFRIAWGVAGTRYARFSEFVYGPSSVIRYIAGMIHGRPTHYVGHNPVGAIAILALMFLGLCCAISGCMVYADVGGEWPEQLHEAASSLMLAMVFVHIAGVLVSSRQHRENLVRAMIDGRKKAEADQGISSNRPIVALFVLASVVGFWTWCFCDAMNFETVTVSASTNQPSMPLWRSSVEAVRTWLWINAGLQPSAPLLPCRHEEGMAQAYAMPPLPLAVEEASTACSALTGRHASPDTIRHTATMHLLQPGIDLSAIALWLGHESPACSDLHSKAGGTALTALFDRNHQPLKAAQTVMIGN